MNKDTTSTNGAADSKADDNKEQSVAGGASNTGALGSGNAGSTLKEPSVAGGAAGGKDEKSSQLTSETRKVGSFPSDLSNIKQIFSVKSKSSQAKDRFALKAQEYLDSHKMAIYLQDAIKIILDRREEKPLDLLTDQ